MMKKVFVVDDDVAILEVLKIVLEEEGYEVLTDTGYKTLEIMQHTRPDLLLLDIWMRGVDGREISRKVKASPDISSTPVVLMSAHSHAESVVAEAKADEFLEKPFDIDTMVRVVKRYV